MRVLIPLSRHGSVLAELASHLKEHGERADVVLFEDVGAADRTDVVIVPVSDAGVLPALRSRGCEIIVVAPEADAPERIALFESGADHVLHGAPTPSEVAAQVRAVVRRRAGAEDAVVLDHGARQAVVYGRPVTLTAVEWKLLVVLMSEPGRVFSSGELMRGAWGTTVGARSTVSTHIRRLRRKIEPDPSKPALIRTVWGAGYVFRPEARAE